MKSAAKIFSFEFYPPKTEKDTELLFTTIGELKDLKPDFVSITNATTGTDPFRTADLSGEIRRRHNLEVMAHLTCVGHSREDIKNIAVRLKKAGIENILALRGDINNIQGLAPKRDYSYASELASDLKQIGGFSIGGAAYPEKHPESSDWAAEICALKAKTASGAEFLITQLFFENKFYFELIEKMAAAGITVPVLPGLMPLTSYSQLQNFAKLFSVALPAAVRAGVEKYAADKESLLKFSIDYASGQAQELLRGGAPGVHFYTLNKSTATKEILKNLAGVRN